MTYKGMSFDVWNSTTGGFNGNVTAHLVRPGSSKTLCGKPRGRMNMRWNTFGDGDCKTCRNKAAELAAFTPDPKEQSQ